jgi:hypothetical protein
MMEHLEDVLAEALPYDDQLQRLILRRAQRIARRVLHPCKHGELGPCSQPHSSDDVQPGWIEAVPLRQRYPDD